MPRAEVLSLPNVISLSRLVMAALFIATRGTAERVVLIGAASASDFLDGWVARRHNLSTRWGALLDPLTDRAFVFTVVSSYLLSGELTTGQYFTLLARDLATATGFLVARGVRWLRSVTFEARLLGKVVTALQLATLLAVLLAPRAVAPLVVAVGVASAAAVADYTLALWRSRAA